MTKINIGKHKISEKELYDRIIAAIPAKQFQTIAKKVNRQLDQIIVDRIPKIQFTRIITKIRKDLDKECK
jgi:predicted dinucleotide-binding enzyme